MARPRTPTALLDARGAFKNHPDRKRDSEPVVKEPLGAPPSRLTGLEVEAWMEIVEFAPMGVLTRADRHAVEQAARLMAESWEDFKSFPTAKLTRLQVTLGQFGMNPSDRSKLSIGKPKDGNPFDSL